MGMRIWISAIAMTSIGLAAFAHSGATGGMKERMDAMSEMGEAMKTLTPMMRGQTGHRLASFFEKMTTCVPIVSSPPFSSSKPVAG